MSLPQSIEEYASRPGQFNEGIRKFVAEYANSYAGSNRSTALESAQSFKRKLVPSSAHSSSSYGPFKGGACGDIDPDNTTLKNVMVMMGIIPPDVNQSHRSAFTGLISGGGVQNETFLKSQIAALSRVTISHLFMAFSIDGVLALFREIAHNPDDPLNITTSRVVFLPSPAGNISPNGMPPVVQSTTENGRIELQHYGIAAECPHDILTTTEGMKFYIGSLLEMARGMHLARMYMILQVLGGLQRELPSTPLRRNVLPTIDAHMNETVRTFAALQRPTTSAFSSLSQHLTTQLSHNGTSGDNIVSVVTANVWALMTNSNPVLTKYSSGGQNAITALQGNPQSQEAIYINGDKVVIVNPVPVPNHGLVQLLSQVIEIGNFVDIIPRMFYNGDSANTVVRVATSDRWQDIDLRECIARMFFWDENGNARDYPGLHGTCCWPYHGDGARPVHISDLYNGAQRAQLGATITNHAEAIQLALTRRGINIDEPTINDIPFTRDAVLALLEAGINVLGCVIARPHQLGMSEPLSRVVSGGLGDYASHGSATTVVSSVSRIRTVISEMYHGVGNLRPENIATARTAVYTARIMPSGESLKPFTNVNEYNPVQWKFDQAGAHYFAVQIGWTPPSSINILGDVTLIGQQFATLGSSQVDRETNGWPGCDLFIKHFDLVTKVHGIERIDPNMPNCTQANWICRRACYRVVNQNGTVENVVGNDHWGEVGTFTRDALKNRTGCMFSEN